LTEHAVVACKAPQDREKTRKKTLAGSDVFKGFPWFSQPSFIAAGYLHQEYHHPVEVSI